jgi:hypothetical protein
VLDHREFVHLDRFPAPRFFPVGPPRSIAEPLQHSQLPVRAADIRRRTLDSKLSLREKAAAPLGPGALTNDPISVPFECVGFAARDEPLVIPAFGATQRLLGAAHGVRRAVPFSLRTREFRLRQLVLPLAQVEYRCSPKMKSLHRGAGLESVQRR